MQSEAIHLDPVLNLSSNGQALAQRVLSLLDSQEQVHLDFGDVERVTPSYANAFVMTLMEQMPLEELRRRVIMRNRVDQVAAAISRSAQRYLNGIRLSTQAPASQPPTSAA